MSDLVSDFEAMLNVKHIEDPVLSGENGSLSHTPSGGGGVGCVPCVH